MYRAAGSMNGCANPLSDRAVEDQRVLGLIRAAYTASHGVYGAPRIFLDLREAGETCSKHRVARIMRANHIKVLALFGCRDGSLLTPNCRLVKQTHSGPRTGAGRDSHGRTATRATTHPDSF